MTEKTSVNLKTETGEKEPKQLPDLQLLNEQLMDSVLKPADYRCLLPEPALWELFRAYVYQRAPHVKIYTRGLYFSLLGFLMKDIHIFAGSYEPDCRISLGLIGVTKTGKSRSMKSVINLLGQMAAMIEKIGLNPVDLGVAVMTISKGSIQRMASDIKDVKERAWCHTDEFGTLLASMRKREADGTESAICSLIDGSSFINRSFSNPITISTPKISHNFAVTPAVLQKYDLEGLITSGYLNRYIPIYADVRPEDIREITREAMEKGHALAKSDEQLLVKTFVALLHLTDPLLFPRWGFIIKKQELKNKILNWAETARKATHYDELFSSIIDNFMISIFRIAAILRITSDPLIIHDIVTKVKNRDFIEERRISVPYIKWIDQEKQVITEQEKNDESETGAKTKKSKKTRKPKKRSKKIPIELVKMEPCPVLFELEESEIDQAIKEVKTFFKSWYEFTGRAEYDRNIEKAITIIYKLGGAATQREILQATGWRTNLDFVTTMKTMIAREEIAGFKLLPGDKGGRPAVIFCKADKFNGDGCSNKCRFYSKCNTRTREELPGD